MTLPNILPALLFICFTVTAEQPPAFGPLQLAEKYTPDIKVSDYLISEKLDGIRARWTGSQLLTRNGILLHAPAWFTRGWPAVPMDGELWTTRGDFQEIASIVLSATPDSRWQNVKMMLFDLPRTDIPFEMRVAAMKTLIANSASPTLSMIYQFTLDSRQALEARLDAISQAGGEGLMLHHKAAHYLNGRNKDLLKAKRYEDAEARVIAHIQGTGQFSNIMGSLLVASKSGVRFKIGSGFSLQERRSPPPIGSWITFKYYGLTQKGIPRFASFLHIRPEQDRPGLSVNQ